MFDIRKFAANGSIFRATARFVVLAIEAAAFSALLLGALPRPAAAAVFEIDSGGSLSVYDVPSVTTSEGVKPIIPDRRDIAPQDIRSLLTAAAQRYALDEKLLVAVARQESGFRAAEVNDLDFWTSRVCLRGWQTIPTANSPESHFKYLQSTALRACGCWNTYSD